MSHICFAKSVLFKNRNILVLISLGSVSLSYFFFQDRIRREQERMRQEQEQKRREADRIRKEQEERRRREEYERRKREEHEKRKREEAERRRREEERVRQVWIFNDILFFKNILLKMKYPFIFLGYIHTYNSKKV